MEVRAPRRERIPIAPGAGPLQTTGHADLVCRVLRVDRALWERVLEDYLRNLTGTTRAERLDAARRAWSAHSPHTAPALPSEVSRCPVCGGAARPEIYRRSGEIYGLCAQCGHGALLTRAAPAKIYCEAEYYSERKHDGVGYDAYRWEMEYREAKADRLLAWMENVTGAPAGRSLLEVGSGFGYTRAAAERRGWRTSGVDLNPHAAAAARDLYGFETRVATLADALSSGLVPRGQSQVVLYQFVLEHIHDPIGELTHAAEAVEAHGFLVLLVPSMQALERVVFGASYRSLRPDHLHLFSWASLDCCLSAACWRRVQSISECSVHLLADFVSREELEEVYLSGDGPDLWTVAQIVEDA